MEKCYRITDTRLLNAYDKRMKQITDIYEHNNI